jgi:hypothetical protein
MREGNKHKPYICTRNLHWFCSVVVNQENTAGYIRSIPPVSPTAKKHVCWIYKWIKFVSRVNIFLWFAPIFSAHKKSVFLLLSKQKAHLLSFVHTVYLFRPLCATLYIWGSHLTEAKYSGPDVPQLTRIHCIYKVSSKYETLIAYLPETCS